MTLKGYGLRPSRRNGDFAKRTQSGDRAGRTLIVSADHPDKATYPTRTFEVKAATLPEVLVGQVVWVGRSLRTRS